MVLFKQAETCRSFYCADAMQSTRIALTGGIATGKSTVAKMFADLGAIIIDADQAAREVVQPGSACWQKLRRLLGNEFFTAEGELKRRELRNCIIADEQCRTQVNAILHPAIVAAMEKRWQDAQKIHPPRIPIFDIPLLFEADSAGRYDLIILVYVPAAVQVERLMTRDGVSREEAERTLTMQLPIESKKERAQIVIDNALDERHTLDQVRAIWNELQTTLGRGAE